MESRGKRKRQDSILLGNRQEIEKSKSRSGGKVAWRSGTPEAVEGRQHVQLQTEVYLEELADVVVEQDQSCQTDQFVERPASPPFVPAKTGMDKETQILEGEVIGKKILCYRRYENALITQF